jgi:hypothetical protein
MVSRCALAIPGFSQSLQGNIQADLIAILETVTDGLGDTSHLHGNPI